MIYIICPICGPGKDRKIIYQENLPLARADFSARKNPDFYHYQMVKCDSCGLLYAERAWAEDKVRGLYEESKFEYDDELPNLQKTYGYYLDKIEKYILTKNSFLEIGCGNGFMLDEALNQGYQNVCGFEPAVQAIEKASPRVKKKIISGFFDSNHFEENRFDVVFFAMVIEHIIDVNKFLQGMFKNLKPGGVVLGIAHDVDSSLSKLLKDKHPIINDEHFYVFSKETIKKIFLKNSFNVLEIDRVANIYSLGYWLKMLPLPKAVKNILLKMLFFKKINLKIKAGNIFIVAQKPIHV